MGILVEPFLRQRDLYQLQHLNGALFGFRLVQIRVQHQRFHDLFSHGKYRVQGSHGLLEDHGDLSAADLAHLILAFLQQIFSLIQDLAAHDFSRRRLYQLHDGKRSDTFSAAGLSHDAQRLSFFHRKGNIIYRFDHTLIGVKISL